MAAKIRNLLELARGWGQLFRGKKPNHLKVPDCSLINS